MDDKRLVGAVLEKALVAQAPLARKNVERLRRVHPEATPSALIRKLNVAYLSAVTVSGGAAGAADQLTTFTRLQLDVVNGGTQRHTDERESIPRPHFCAFP